MLFTGFLNKELQTIDVLRCVNSKTMDVNRMAFFYYNKQVAAPMVRFSKLPFRHLVRSWGADIVFTPMIMANSFVASAKARDVEFTTNAYDRCGPSRLCIIQSHNRAVKPRSVQATCRAVRRAHGH